MKNLVIVESPTKARTIGKFLGKDYEIMSSMGHVVDLPKSKLGVLIEEKFAPQYEVVASKKKLIAELTRAAKGADVIILATDPDREGEAIASTIRDVLIKSPHFAKASRGKQKFKRIAFHEITEEAIKDALAHPRDVDTNLVNAQTARRVLDRLVGYQLSPVLWRKIRRGLSAGRVQSVALRLIVEREREREKFAKEKYWSIHAILSQKSPHHPDFAKATSGKQGFAGQAKVESQNEGTEFSLIEINGEKIEVSQKFTLYDGEYKVTKTIIDSQQKADEIVRDIEGNSFVVANVAQKQMKRSPNAPFTTSTLQQDASRRFGFSGKRTMSLAQRLYEEGHITYHRTDSVTLSSSAIIQIRAYIQKGYGEKYVPEKPRNYSVKQKLAQEAHEGIRPTKVEINKMKIEGLLGEDYGKLYDLIWMRAIASQMSDAMIESTTVLVDSDARGPVAPSSRPTCLPAGRRPQLRALDGTASGRATPRFRFKTNGSVLVFDGFLKLTPQALQDVQLPKFTSGESLIFNKGYSELHETLPPPRYNDASLIGTLEEKGIGRPSTYASIIFTIIDRGYVERIERRFIPSSVGMTVTDFLVSNFSVIDDVPFTAAMEDELDQVADGRKEWHEMIGDFYNPFSKKLKEVESADRVKIAVEETSEICPECKKSNLVVRTGKFGKFLSCGAFPECKFTKPYTEETKYSCPKDGGKVVVKKTRKGRKFYGCSNYPKCTFASWNLEEIKKTVV